MDSTLPKFPAQLLGILLTKSLRNPPYKFHFPKNFRLRRANPENVLRAAIVSIWSPEFVARSYCVDLGSRNVFWAAIEGGLLLGTRRYVTSGNVYIYKFNFLVESPHYTLYILESLSIF